MTQVYINLPVKDLQKSVQFFTALGYTFNPQFTDNTATCMIVSDTIFVMLLTHDKFKEFIPGGISDAGKSTEVLVCLSAESKEAVDAIANKAIAAGGRIFKEPIDYGFMYGRSFQDLDGHIWEHMYMDPNGMPECGSANAQGGQQ